MCNIAQIQTNKGNLNMTDLLIRSDTTKLLTNNINLMMQQIAKLNAEMSSTYSVFLTHKGNEKILNELEQGMKALIKVRTNELKLLNLK